MISILNKEETKEILRDGTVVFNNDSSIVLLVNTNGWSEKRYYDLDCLLDESFEGCLFSLSPEFKLLSIKHHYVESSASIKDLTDDQLLITFEM